MSSEAQLNFLGFSVTQVDFNRNLGFTQSEFDIELEFKAQHPTIEDKKNFAIFFDVKITSKNPDGNPCHLNIKANGAFKIVGEPSQPVYDNYTRLSAPSIVYPYIRAYVSNLFTMSGLTPLILTPVNFATATNTTGKEDIKAEGK